MCTPCWYLLVVLMRRCDAWVKVPVHSRPLLRQSPQMNSPALSEALRNSGESAVFNNVNVGSAVVKGVRRMLNPKDQPWLRPAIASLTGGIDEIVFIFFYLLLIDRVLKGLWTLGHILPWSPGGAKVTKEERSESNYDRSLLGYLRAPARTLGWSMLSIWFVDAVVIIMTAMGPPMTK